MLTLLFLHRLELKCRKCLIEDGNVVLQKKFVYCKWVKIIQQLTSLTNYIVFILGLVLCLWLLISFVLPLANQN